MEAITRHRGALRPTMLGLLVAVALAGLAAAPAQASTPARPAPVAAAGDQPDQPDQGIALDAQSAPLTPADRDLVVKVRLAGLWEQPAGAMAVQKGVNPRVREIGQMIADQHVKLDALDRAAAKKLGVPLPNQPTPEQQRWLAEMANATGPRFDDIFVMRLRAAHGKIFPAIGLVRATTRNDIVRTLAQQANGFVMNHLTYLESTGLVQYQELPAAPRPHTGPLTPKTQRNALGGPATPMIWAVLAIALLSGLVASGRMIRPRSFGGRPRGDLRPVPVRAFADAGPDRNAAARRPPGDHGPAYPPNRPPAYPPNRQPAYPPVQAPVQAPVYAPAGAPAYLRARPSGVPQPGTRTWPVDRRIPREPSPTAHLTRS